MRRKYKKRVWGSRFQCSTTDVTSRGSAKRRFEFRGRGGKAQLDARGAKKSGKHWGDNSGRGGNVDYEFGK